MGKGQRARMAAAKEAVASLAATPAPSAFVSAPLPPPSSGRLGLGFVAPSAPSKFGIGLGAVPASKKTSSTVSSTSSSDPEYEPTRVLATDEDRETLLALTDEAERTAFVDAILARVFGAVSVVDRRAAVDDLVVAVDALGAGSHDGVHVLRDVRKNMVAKPAAAREGALFALAAMSKCDAISCVIEPILVELFVPIMDRHADKETNVRQAAAATATALVAVVNPLATRTLLKQLYVALELRGWQSKVAALDVLGAFSANAQHEIDSCLPEIIPKVSDYVWDTKPQVQEAALKALRVACSMINNDDVVPLVPQLVNVIAHPEQTIKVIDSLLATTFVANIEASTLSLVAPLLSKALRDHSTNSSSLSRKASIIIDSMCRLVVRPCDVTPFLPMLLPQMDTVINRLTDEDIKEVVVAARERLVTAAGKGVEEEDPVEIRKALQDKLVKGLHGALDLATHPGLDDATIEYVSDVCAELVTMQRGAEWAGFVLPYLNPHMHDEDAERVSEALKAAGGGLGGARVKSTDPNDVCDLDFSLAYGGKVLLRNARLRLTRGHRYGLVGKNGVGKTTLMRNISTGAIEGLPESVRTVYVQHEDIVESNGSLLESMIVAPELAHCTRERVESTLTDIGFTREHLDGPIDALSGGWRMKLAIARAMLYNADVLLLDEPTNHLDVHAVAWLVGYLNSLERMTVLLVSHDTGFLDNVCTDIFHYESKQLVLYPGTLSHFVSIHPEAKHYYELKSSDTVFNLPQPGRLEGISSTTRRILSMEHCTYTYPGAAKPQLVDVSVKLCLASRVAVIGVNGAGKSTLIKMIVQETSPDTGEMWKHHNLRVAYVAQHSFHHVEKHLDSSPVEYIQWRFGTEGGIDRELSSRVNINPSVEEQEAVRKSNIEKIMSRRKGKRGTLEYEVKFIGQGESKNRFYTLEKMQELGLGKLAEMEDARQATLASGMDLRPLTTKEVQRHLSDFGLDVEFGTHGKILGLSGGQKVKLVLAAAMWNRPHLLVLDEPTNYLDRAALGALADGIREFGGGVIMISHSEEFYNSLCTEKWLVESGRVRVVGEAIETEYRAGGGKKVFDEDDEEEKDVGKFGGSNGRMKQEGIVINPKSLRPLSTKDKRKMQKLANAAGMGMQEYVNTITRASPEWKWLSS